MSDLPPSIYPVLIFGVIGLSLIAYFGSREYLLAHYLKKGMKAYEAGSFKIALHWLLKAERKWGLNNTKQTKASHVVDCQKLRRILHLVSDAASHCDLQIETAAYSQAVLEVEQYFANKGAAKKYPAIYQALKDHRKEFGRIVENVSL
jgi:hypothetical protein